MWMIGKAYSMRGGGDAVGVLEVQISCQSADAVATVVAHNYRSVEGEKGGGGGAACTDCTAGRYDHAYAVCIRLATCAYM
jgi:hypothetical protein